MAKWSNLPKYYPGLDLVRQIKAEIDSLQLAIKTTCGNSQSWAQVVEKVTSTSSDRHEGSEWIGGGRTTTYHVASWRLVDVPVDAAQAEFDAKIAALEAKLSLAISKLIPAQHAVVSFVLTWLQQTLSCPAYDECRGVLGECGYAAEIPERIVQQAVHESRAGFASIEVVERPNPFAALKGKF